MSSLTANERPWCCYLRSERINHELIYHAPLSDRLIVDKVQTSLDNSDIKHRIINKDSWTSTLWNPPWEKARTVSLLKDHPQHVKRLRSKNNSHLEVDSTASGREYIRAIEGNDLSLDVRKLSKEGRLNEAVQIVDKMIQCGNEVSINTFAALLQECGRNKALATGKQVHLQILKSGYKSNILLGNTLVDMYGKCGSMVNARQVFDEMPKHNIYSWTAIVSAYTKQGQGLEAIRLFKEMQKDGLHPDKVMFIAVLKACTDSGSLEWGKQVHDQIIKSGLESDLMVGNTVIDMYAKCGSIGQAREVFNQLCERNVVSWTVMIAGYTQQGLGEEAFILFEEMQQQAIVPNDITYVSILQACAKMMALDQGGGSNVSPSSFGDLTSGILRGAVEKEKACGRRPNHMADPRIYFPCDITSSLSTFGRPPCRTMSW